MAAEKKVTSDIDCLKKVLVQPLLGEERKVLPLFPILDLPGFSIDIVGNNAQKQHKGFQELLRSEGVEVLEVPTLLNSALEESRREGSLGQFIDRHYPHYRGMESGLSAADLIGASQKVYEDPNRENLYRTRPLQWMYYSRDIAIATPKGIVVTAFNDDRRGRETALTRFMFEKAPELSDCPIVFDAEKEGVKIQGGDTIVLNEESLLLGVDNMSSRGAAERMAQKLGIDVYAVQMPKGPEHLKKDVFALTEVNTLFLHLDTIFNLADKDKALALPYFLETRFQQAPPFSKILNAASAEVRSEEERLLLDGVATSLEGFGDVSIYQRDTGKKLDLNKKLVDFMRENLGYQIAYIGGSPKEDTQDQVPHLVEDVLRETRFQAGNIVAVKPGRVLMYEDDTQSTQHSLANIGVQVKTFVGYELARWNGGPHCMTCPLVRV